MLEKLKERKGVLLPVALVVMLMAGGLSYYTTQALLDRKMLNQDTNLTSFAQREADNAMAHALWAANTPPSQNSLGKKGTTFTSGGLVETTDEDGGVKETSEGYIVKRFVQFSGGNLTTMGRIYNSSGTLVAERKASIACDPTTTPIKVQKDTLKYFD